LNKNDKSVGLLLCFLIYCLIFWGVLQFLKNKSNQPFFGENQLIFIDIVIRAYPSSNSNSQTQREAMGKNKISGV
jgi:hypothetical protein